MRVGDELELDIVATDEHGRGLAEHDGRRVSVPGAFAGERVRVRVEALARHSKLAHARLLELVQASPDRRPPPCPRHEHSPGRKLGCGGCPLMALTIEAQREQERRRIEADYGLVLDGPIVGGDEFGYRASSKRIAYGRAGRLRLGSRLAGAQHDDRVANMHGCLVDHPRLRAAFDELERVANELSIIPGDELRYVWAKTNGEQVLLTLIGPESTRGPESRFESPRSPADAGPSRAGLSESPRSPADAGPSRAGLSESPRSPADAGPSRAGWRVSEQLAVRLHREGIVDGVAFGVQAEAGNAIRGEPPRHIAGLQRLPLELLGVRLELGPLGFLQPNPQVAALAYRDLIGDAAGGLALDLYAGAGVTTHLLRERFAEVIPCEAYAESAAALGVEPSTAEDFCRTWLEHGRPTPDLIVANPPRAGLGASVCASLVELRTPSLRIMSCSAKTLAADLRRLSPTYELVSLRGYDTLPHTPHIELVATLVLMDPR